MQASHQVLEKTAESQKSLPVFSSLLALAKSEIQESKFVNKLEESTSDLLKPRTYTDRLCLWSTVMFLLPTLCYTGMKDFSIPQSLGFNNLWGFSIHYFSKSLDIWIIYFSHIKKTLYIILFVEYNFENRYKNNRTYKLNKKPN